MSVLANVQPKDVFHYFEEISAIPRGSGNEKAVAEYCVDFANAHNLEVIADKLNNVVIKKAASFGCENAPVVMLQGHLDMVCEKNAGTVHDFLKDGIKIIVDGDRIKAEGTTLGADNGIAVALMLAILADKDAVHPALECVFTVDEEVGLKGAQNLDCSHLRAKYLINLDSEEYGRVLVSCAGGLRADSVLPINRVPSGISDFSTYSVFISGLKGGHSGAEIHLERGNANKLLGRFLDFISGKVGFEICHIEGGAKDNAIPREATVILNISGADTVKLEESAAAFESIITEEFKLIEDSISVTCKSVEYTGAGVFCKATAQNAVALIMGIPNGVLAMSAGMPGLVETSNNLGVMRTTEEELKLTSAIRSSVGTRKDWVAAIIKNVTVLAGAKFSENSSYPGWKYDPDSELRRIAARSFKKVSGADIEEVAFHAGVECGTFKESMKDLDIISIGPDMSDVHTPCESLSIDSTAKTYEFLKEMLRAVCAE